LIDFTENQSKTIASGLTLLSLAVVFAFVSAVAWFLLKLLAFTAPALVPVIIGFFLALFFRPYYRLWQRWLRNPTLALVVMLLTVLVPLFLLLWYAGAVLLVQVSNLLAQGPALANQVMCWFRETFPTLSQLLSQAGMPFENPGDVFAKYGSTAMKAGSGALKCLSGVLSALLSLVFFVFFLMTKERRGAGMVSHLPFLKEETRQFLSLQIDAFTEILVSFFQRQVIICLIEGVMYGTGFWLVGLPYGFLIGFALGVINLIPFFGSIVCLPVAVPMAYFPHGGSLQRLVLVLAVWLAGQLLDGYLITPRIQGDKTGLGYAGVIFSFIFWATVLGPVLGMLLAIPLSAFCVVFWRGLKARYIRPVF